MSYERVETEAIPLIADAAERDDGDDQVYSPKSELHDGGSSSRSLRERSGGSKLSLSTILVVSAFAASLVSLLCSALILTSTLRGHGSPQTGTSATSNASSTKKLLIQDLRRPSLYIGMERVPEYSVSKHAPPVHDQQPGQVSVETKHPGTPREMARVNSRFPTVSFPQDGWVFLTEDDRTLMYFSVPPNASHCALRGTFPQRQDLGLESPVQILTLERDDSISYHPDISFTALSLPTPRTLSSVTFDTRPVAGPVLGSLRAAFGTVVETERFRCRGGPVLVEARCLGGGCRVEYEYPDVGAMIGPAGKEKVAVPLGITLVQA